MKIKKSELISAYSQSVGIEAAKELIARKINVTALEDKEDYTTEEITRVCGELSKDDGLIRIVAQTFLVRLEREKSEEQTLLLDNIETHIWYLTDIETYGTVNKAHADFLGIEKKDLEDRSLYDLFNREEAEICIAGNREVFEKKKQIRGEEWIKNSKGEARLLSITRTPKVGDNGNVEYVVCTGEDITEHKRSDDELKKKVDELERYKSVT
ncbi:MAG: PAS domain-containing protein, partial [Candidatus Thermoplasmatota archaeon]|nr:PAS domain-containing protein [Candidatus Thermoplasmatota archaeon]